MVAFHRWETPFAKFVREFGAQKLADELHVQRSAIYHWISGSVRPNPDNTTRIVELSNSTKTPLKFEDVYTHADSIGRARPRRRYAQRKIGHAPGAAEVAQA